MLQIELDRPTEGSLQSTYERLLEMKDDNGWTVIIRHNFLPSRERSYVGIKKGQLILELAEPPKSS